MPSIEDQLEQLQQKYRQLQSDYAYLMEEKTELEERCRRSHKQEEQVKRELLNEMNKSATLRVEARMLREQLDKELPVRMQRQAEQELIRAARMIVALAEDPSPAKPPKASIEQLSLQLDSKE